MAAARVREQILQALDRLSPAQQREVLRYIREMPEERLPGVLSREELMEFAGSITLADLEAMEAAIEESCERIDPREWNVDLP